MTSTRTKGTSPKKKTGSSGSSKKGGLDDILGYGFLALVALAAVRTALAEAVPRFTFWWNDSFVPWWHDILPLLIAGLFFFGVVPAALYAWWRWQHRERHAIRRRVAKRQPDDVPTKPKVRDDQREDHDGDHEIVIPMPKGKVTTDKAAKKLADHHGRDIFGEPADYEVRVNRKSGHDEVVLRRPTAEPVDDRPQIEQDLTKIAQEHLPHVQAVTVAAKDEKTGLPTRVEVHHEVTAKLLSTPAIGEAIERTLAAHLGWDDPNTYRMHWDRERSVGILEQCDDPLPRVVPFPFGKISDIIDRESKRLYYGVNADGDLVYWDLDCAPHSLVAGKTGSGKTVALTTFVVMALLMGWQVIMIDPKKKAFRDLDGLPNFERHGDAKGLDSAREMAAAIDAAHDIMEARYDLDKKALKKEQRILFLIDETFICIEALNDLWAEEKEPGDRTTEHPSVGKLRRMSGLAREALMHMMLAIQRPDTSLMGNKGAGYMRSNLDNKISIGPMDSDGAPMMFGRGTRWARLAQAIPTVKGRALGSLPDGATGYQMAQVWFVDVDDDNVLKQVGDIVVQMHGRHERLVDVPSSEPADDDDSGEQPAVDLDKPEPERPAPPRKAVAKKAVAKKAVARRAPAKKAAVSADSPEVISRDWAHADQLVKGDWVRIPDGAGGSRDVRIATEPQLDEDAETVTASGFGWKHTWPMLENVMLLTVVDDDEDE